MISDIINLLVEQISYIAEPTFFEFVREFVKHYATAIGDRILGIFEAVTKRVLVE